MQYQIAAVVLILGTLASRAPAAENDAYRLEAGDGGAVVITHKSGGASATFRPSFDVVFSAADPKLANKGKIVEPWRNGKPFNFVVPQWGAETDFFKIAATRTAMSATDAAPSGNGFGWRFPPSADKSKLSATVELPPGSAEPVLSFTFTPGAAGFYAVGYTGAPETIPDKLDWMWQPLLWQQKRFPAKAYFTPEYQCPIPVAMASTGGVVVGVAADPVESPYRLPSFADSRFGLLVRNAKGNAQPAVYAPVLGGEGSKMSAGKPMAFKMRLVVRKGEWFETYKSLAEGLYGFGDYRRNSLTSLNETLDNLVDFIMDDRYSYWFPEFKTNGYQTDAPGFGRQQSAVTALSLAMVRDSQAIYDRRALPSIEYMLSRRTLLYNLKEYEEKNGLGGPVGGMEVDWAALYRMSGGRTALFRDHVEKAAKKVPSDVGIKPAADRAAALDAAKDHLNTLIAAFRTTGERSYLDRARRVADDYIKFRVAQPATDFSDAGSSFWHEVTPMWDALAELYDETNDNRYLDASIAGLKEFAGFVYLQPLVPDKDIRVNPGGTVRGMKAPEETVPAWRVSANGLTAECGGTAHSHRGIFMAPYAAYMRRAAFQADESFFNDIARAAIVGRYANYPSYAYRFQHTTLIEKPDYPLRPFEELTFTSEHYNHPMPMATYLIDFLVADTYARSKGQIAFPSQFTSTGAYFRNKVYGDRPGSFYGESGVNLWLPKGLLKADNVQVNYVAGCGNGKLYLALTNQSPHPIAKTAIQLNPDLVSLAATAKARVIVDGAPAADMALHNGVATVAISAKGITCLIIEGATPRTELQPKYLARSDAPVGGWTQRETDAPFGRVAANVLSFGDDLTSGYVWLNSTPAQLKRATVSYSVDGGAPKQIADETHPFEFTLPLPAGARQVGVTVEGTKHDGAAVRVEPFMLSR